MSCSLSPSFKRLPLSGENPGGSNNSLTSSCSLFFFQAEDGIRGGHVTGVQTCALPISEHLGLIVISEDFRVATPIHHGIERFLGGGIAQRVLELLLEAYPGRAVTGALVEHVSDVLRQRYRGKEVPGEDHLARLRIEIGKIARRRAQQNVALPDLGKAEVMQNFGDREQ